MEISVHNWVVVLFWLVVGAVLVFMLGIEVGNWWFTIKMKRTYDRDRERMDREIQDQIRASRKEGDHHE